MAVEREILQDITKYKTRFLGPFSVREIVCIGIIVAIDVPAFLILSKFFVMSFVMPCLIFLALPPALCGFFPIYDMPFEKFVISIIQTQILSPRIRKYKGKTGVEKFLESNGGIPTPKFKKNKPTKKENVEELDDELEELLIAGKKTS